MVIALDGRLFATVTHRTIPFTVVISGNHHEQVHLFFNPSLTYPVVL